jgi:hypothetical protein
MFTAQFWKLAAERAVKVFAESLAAVLVASGAGLLTADWKTALSTAGMATFVSLLTSLASLHVGPKNSPSVVRPEQLPATASAPTPAPVPAAVHAEPQPVPVAA